MNFQDAATYASMLECIYWFKAATNDDQSVDYFLTSNDTGTTLL